MNKIEQIVQQYINTINSIPKSLSEEERDIILQRAYIALANKIAALSAKEAVAENKRVSKELESKESSLKEEAIIAMVLVSTIKGRTLLEWLNTTEYKDLLSKKTIANIRGITHYYVQAAVQSAKLSAMKLAGVKRVRYTVHWTPGTCNICAPDDGKVFDIGKGPSLGRHLNCRCTYEPVK